MTGKEICWLQISSGRGPVECELAVTKTANKIIKEANQSGLNADIIELQPGQNRDTARSCLISLSGQELGTFIEKWVGSILWICKSPYRPNHKRKNWFISIETLEPIDNQNYSLKLKDIKFQSLRASGPGGQHVNTTESAVRAIHIPTGLSVLASEERSQHMNKKLAIARIAQKLSGIKDNENKQNKQTQWTQHDSLKRGDAIRIFEGNRFIEK